MQIKKELLEYDKKLSELCKKNKSINFDVLDFSDEVTGIEVITYQKFLYKKASEYNNYSIIVADEAHFFCSDALFCLDTSSILHKICNNFGKIPRIYITATDSEVFGTIAKYENYSMLDYSKNCEFLGIKDEILAKQNIASGLYSVQNAINYHNARLLENNMMYNDINSQAMNNNIEHYLTLKFFYYSLERDNKNYRLYPIEYETKDESIKKIVCGTKKGKKTIIFVNSKKYDEKLKKDLDKLSRENSEDKIKTIYIDSESKNKDEEEFKNIVLNEKFDSDVLISTSVLDNGVNICDNDIENVIILYFDKIAFLQSLGRVRLKKGQYINVIFGKL